jgi:hypothetical protein
VQATNFELVINISARALGLAISDSMQLLADETLSKFRTPARPCAP